MSSSLSRSKSVLRLARIPVFYTVLYSIFFCPVLVRGQLLAPGDGLAYFLPAYYGHERIWTARLFTGFATAGDPQAMGWYPPAMVFSLIPGSWNAFVILGYVLAGTFGCLLVRRLSGSGLAGLLAGIVYSMSGFLMAHLGHTNMIHAAAWLPLILLALDHLRDGPSRWWLAAGSVGAGLCFLAGHPQIAWQSMALCAGYALVAGVWCGSSHHAGLARCNELHPTRFLHSFPMAHPTVTYYCLALLMVIVGAALAAIQILPMLELARHSVRDAITFAWFKEPSIPVLQLVSTLLYPSVLGGPGRVLYHFPFIGATSVTETAVYVGLLPLMLSAAALLRPRKRGQVVFWFVIAIIALLLTLGDRTPLCWILYHLPGFRSFRAPARHALEFTMAISILSGLGLAALKASARGESDATRGAAAAPRRWPALVGIVVVGLAIAAVAIILWIHVPDLARRFHEAGSPHWSLRPWRNPAVAIPMILSALCAAALLVYALRLSRPSAALLLSIAIIDLARQ